jgi:hypothetical protein
MSKPLEELRAQRALIKQHLHWLDHQIEKAERADRGTEPTGMAANQPNLSAATTQRQRALASQAVAPATSTYGIDENPPLTPGTSDIMRAKIGCLAIFGFATFLFLFLLFGLPYLID